MAKLNTKCLDLLAPPHCPSPITTPHNPPSPTPSLTCILHQCRHRHGGRIPSPPGDHQSGGSDPRHLRCVDEQGQGLDVVEANGGEGEGLLLPLNLLGLAISVGRVVNENSNL